MDRRQYLGLTGASITALLSGCSSSDQGDRPDSTATATETETATGTAIATATETEEPTSSPTGTPPEEEFLVNDDFETAYEESIPGEGSEIRNRVEQNYDFAAVESQLEETDEVEFGEVVLEGLSTVFEDEDLTTWENAKEMAKATRYVIHKGLSEEHRKDFTLPDASKEGVSNEESDQAAQNSYFVLPNSMSIGEIEHGVDIHSEHGITTLFAEARGTAEDPTGNYKIFDQNILDPEEFAKYIVAAREDDREAIAELDGNERVLPHLYFTETVTEKDTYRWENYDSVLGDGAEAPPRAIESFHDQLSKLFPFVDPERLVYTRDGAKLMDEKIIPEVSEDGEIESYDHTAYADLYNKVSGVIKEGENIEVGAEGGEFTVQGTSEYSNSELFAS